jgi:phage-related protein
MANLLAQVHGFQKKSRRGKKTPQLDLELIQMRLKAAERMYGETYGKKK